MAYLPPEHPAPSRLSNSTSGTPQPAASASIRCSEPQHHIQLPPLHAHQLQLRPDSADHPPPPRPVKSGSVRGGRGGPKACRARSLPLPAHVWFLELEMELEEGGGEGSLASSIISEEAFGAEAVAAGCCGDGEAAAGGGGDEAVAGCSMGRSNSEEHLLHCVAVAAEAARARGAGAGSGSGCSPQSPFAVYNSFTPFDDDDGGRGGVGGDAGGTQAGPPPLQPSSGGELDPAASASSSRPPLPFASPFALAAGMPDDAAPGSADLSFSVCLPPPKLLQQQQLGLSFPTYSAPLLAGPGASIGTPGSCSSLSQHSPFSPSSVSFLSPFSVLDVQSGELSLSCSPPTRARGSAGGDVGCSSSSGARKVPQQAPPPGPVFTIGSPRGGVSPASMLAGPGSVWGGLLTEYADAGAGRSSVGGGEALAAGRPLDMPGVAAGEGDVDSLAVQLSGPSSGSSGGSGSALQACTTWLKV